jgi:hypothetical protein
MKDEDTKEMIPTRISGRFSTSNSSVDIEIIRREVTACSQVDQD